MSDPAWLVYTLAFVTPEERKILQVPLLADRTSYDNGRGYARSDLETAINNAMDVTTLKRFRATIRVQRPCRRPDFSLKPCGRGIKFST
jgi:hypothetical protein